MAAAPVPAQTAGEPAYDLGERLAEIASASGATKLDLVHDTLLTSGSRDPDIVKPLIADCLDLSISLRDEARRAYCSLRRGTFAYWTERDEASAWTAFLEAESISQRSGDYETLYRALYWLGFVSVEREEFAPGIDFWNRAAEVSLKAGDKARAAHLVIDVSRVFAEFNDPVEADRLLEIARTYARDSGDPFVSYAIDTADGRNRIYQGDYAGAVAAFKRTIDNPLGLPEMTPLYATQAWAGLAIAAARLGDPAALDHARKARAFADSEGSDLLDGFALFAEAEAALAAGDTGLAERAVAAISAHSEGMFGVLTNAHEVMLLQARTLALKGDYPGAYESLMSAFEMTNDVRRRKALQAGAVARAQGETRERETELALAMARSELAEAMLKRRTMMLSLIVTALTVVSLLASLAYVLFRRAQRSALALAESNAEIRAQSRLLDRSLEEKRILLREINHRVKNNLQTISSLVEMQAERLANDESTRAAQALREVYGRIETMSVLQRQIFGLDGAPYASVKSFCSDMLLSLVRLFGKPVAIDLDVEDIELEVRILNPLGLLLNELASNALEHAFTEEGGTLRVAFRRSGADHVLDVADTGGGMPAGFDLARNASMGLRLVRNLARQLRGRVQLVEAARGTHWRLTFPAPNGQNGQNGMRGAATVGDG